MHSTLLFSSGEVTGLSYPGQLGVAGALGLHTDGKMWQLFPLKVSRFLSWELFSPGLTTLSYHTLQELRTPSRHYRPEKPATQLSTGPLLAASPSHFRGRSRPPGGFYLSGV